MKNVINVIKHLGIQDNPPLQLAIVLGAGETTVYKLTTAYAIIANGGKKITPTVIDWVQDRQGKIIYKHDKRQSDFLRASKWDGVTIPEVEDNREQILDPALAYMVTSILQGAIENSQAKTAYVPGQILAGKSGTTNDSKDVWFVGYSAKLIVGIYIGYDTPQDLGKMATGGWLAAPVFKSFMTKALENEPAVPFKIPSNAKLYRVNKNTGQPTTANDPDAMWEINWEKTPVFQVEDEPTPEELQEPPATIPSDEPPQHETPPSNPGIF